MTANETTKDAPKWLKFMRWNFQGPRPKPFWRKHLDDMVEEVEPIEVGGTDPVIDATGGLWNAVALLVGGAIFISAVSLLVGAIFLSPGFFEVGVADPLGRWYASFCFATGQCELGYLLAGTVVGVLVLTLAVITFVAGFPRETAGAEPMVMPDVGTEIVDALGVIDERLVRFRADMVLNGILPLSNEEQEEDEEDETKEVARSLPAFPQWLAMAFWLGTTALLLWLIFGPLRNVIVAAGGGAQLLTLSMTCVLPFAVVFVLMRYDQWVRFQKAETVMTAPVGEPAPAVPALEVPAWEFPKPLTYERPELTKEHQADAGKLAVQLTGNKSTMQIRAAVASVLLENQLLTLEVNEHRAARGLEPTPTHHEEVK
jgi:hypothetical protein